MSGIDDFYLADNGTHNPASTNKINYPMTDAVTVEDMSTYAWDGSSHPFSNITILMLKNDSPAAGFSITYTAETGYKHVAPTPVNFSAGDLLDVVVQKTTDTDTLYVSVTLRMNKT